MGSDLRALILIVALAAALRFYGLGSESLFMDEVVTAQRLEQNGCLQLLTDWDSWTQGPAYYLLNDNFCDYFGYSEFSLRFLSALYGVLAVYAIYRLAVSLFSRRVALLAALLLALNPLAIHYAQDARPYSLFLFAAAASCGAGVQMLEDSRLHVIVAYVCFTLLALLSHPFGPFLLLGEALLFAVIWRDIPSERRSRRHVRRIWACFAVTLLLYLPQGIRFARHLFIQQEGFNNPDWILPPVAKDLLIALDKYVMFWGAGVAIAVIAACVLFIYIRSGRRIPARVWALAGFFLIFYLLPWIVSFVVSPIYRPRYTIPALIPLCMLSAWGIEQLRSKLHRPATILLVLLFSWPVYHYHTGIDKAPWRDAASLLREDSTKSQRIIPHPYWTSGLLKYYGVASNRLWKPGIAAELDGPASDDETIWMLQSYESNSPPLESLQSWLSSLYVVDTTFAVEGRQRQNPYAYWVAPLKLTRYNRR